MKKKRAYTLPTREQLDQRERFIKIAMASINSLVNNGNYPFLLKSKIVCSQEVRDITIYKKHFEQRYINGQTNVYIDLSIEYDLSEINVKRIIYKLNKRADSFKD